MIPTALTIAGSDPSGGAGIQADLKTFHEHRVYGMAAITLLTVQNTAGVKSVQVLDPAFVKDQIESVVTDIAPKAVKTGALGSALVIETAALCAEKFNFLLVVDPVMVSKHGAPLMDQSAVETLIRRLLPKALLVTPNLDEAAALSGMAFSGKESIPKMAEIILRMGPRAVLIKGGHRQDEATDYYLSGGEEKWFASELVQTRHTHGTGCTYSAAITANLARGVKLLDAVLKAKSYITRAIKTAPGFGTGCGPVNHFAGYED